MCFLTFFEWLAIHFFSLKICFKNKDSFVINIHITNCGSNFHSYRKWSRRRDLMGFFPRVYLILTNLQTDDENSKRRWILKHLEKNCSVLQRSGNLCVLYPTAERGNRGINGQSNQARLHFQSLFVTLTNINNFFMNKRHTVQI